MHSSAVNISSQIKQGIHSGHSTKVLIAAGGTGGHVYPAIAIADALSDECTDIEILFVGTKDHLEWEVVPRAGYDISNIWISGFHRRLTVKNLLFPIKLGTSLIQSYQIISKFNPDAVISCGGYAAGPVCWVAARRGIPLIVQEQNSFPGVTNRLLGKNADLIFIAFQEAAAHFPEDKTVLTGNPTRSSLTNIDSSDAYNAFNLDSSKQTLLILGGSGGAKSINQAMANHIATLHDDLELQIIWQCGQRYFDWLREEVNIQNFENLRLYDFLHNMPAAYAAADLVISRAGALSCAELALTGKPSLLVPSPNVAGDHQLKNARAMVESGVAELTKDEELDQTITELVEKLISNQQKLKKMRKEALKLAHPEAAQNIAANILSLIEQNQEISQ